MSIPCCTRGSRRLDAGVGRGIHSNVVTVLVTTLPCSPTTDAIVQKILCLEIFPTKGLLPKVALEYCKSPWGDKFSTLLLTLVQPKAFKQSNLQTLTAVVYGTIWRLMALDQFQSNLVHHCAQLRVHELHDPC